MVDTALLEQVMQLDEAARLELREAIDISLGGYPSEATIALLKERVAEADANPDDYITLDDFKRQVQSRRSA